MHNYIISINWVYIFYIYYYINKLYITIQLGIKTMNNSNVGDKG